MRKLWKYVDPVGKKFWKLTYTHLKIRKSTINDLIMFLHFFQEDQTRGQKSAPASLAASRESLFDGYGRSPRCATPVEQYNKRYSADLTKLGECDIMSQASGGNPQRGISPSLYISARRFIVSLFRINVFHCHVVSQ